MYDLTPPPSSERVDLDGTIGLPKVCRVEPDDVYSLLRMSPVDGRRSGSQRARYRLRTDILQVQTGGFCDDHGLLRTCADREPLPDGMLATMQS